MIIGCWGNQSHKDGGGFRDCLPPCSWVPETCPELAQPSEAKTQTSLTVVDVGALFPGAQPPKLMENVPPNWSSISSSSIAPDPEHCSEASLLLALWHALSTASFIMCLKSHVGLICMGTENGLQWAPCYCWGFYLA